LTSLLFKEGERRMSEEPELLTERAGAVEWITLNRPHRSNALTPSLVETLAGHLAELQADESARVIVLRGAGSAFCAGLDIKSKVARDAERDSDSQDEDRLPDLMRDIIVALHRCPQPVIALLQGPVCGGGFAMALAADIRVAAESAKMKIATLPLGMTSCELGASYFLPRYVGTSVATEMMLTDGWIYSDRALRTGLVSEVVPDADLGETAQRLVSQMVRTTPMGLRNTKITLQRCAELDRLEDVLDLERAAQDECLVGPHFQEGLNAFMEKREPNFT
jgi:enoyl-CoA hydratase